MECRARDTSAQSQAQDVAPWELVRMVSTSPKRSMCSPPAPMKWSLLAPVGTQPAGNWLGCITWVTALESAATTMVISAGAKPRISPPDPDRSSRLSRLAPSLRLWPVEECVGSGGGTPKGVAHVSSWGLSRLAHVDGFAWLSEANLTFRSFCERPENLLAEETKSFKTARCGVGRAVFFGKENPSFRADRLLRGEPL